MQQSQRAIGNPALDVAIAEANVRALPVVVAFGLTESYPDATARAYAFMLEGLSEIARALARRGAAFVIRRGAPDVVALALAAEAALVVCDRGYLRHQRAWRDTVVVRAPCRVIEVEGDLVVPVAQASPKHEIAARTLRPRLQRLWDEYLDEVPEAPILHSAGGLDLIGDVDLGDIELVLRGLPIDRTVAPVRRFRGGYAAARQRLERFLERGLASYGEKRATVDPVDVSGLSPYLHFGQISPVEIARAARDHRASAAGHAAFLDELIVRRELAVNHVYYDERYDGYDAVPDWARKSLDKHRSDRRPFLYSAEQLAAGETHDRWWNAAMREMRLTGYMHNRLRMYWGKKILEWSRSPEDAFAVAVQLNNRYFLDGRDANSYANVAWLLGLHDRPWAERPIFGTVRYMNENSLRKLSLDDYRRHVETLAAAEEA
ncbi:MAG TPA: deoxyribodipyrimidine photo-lyase [Stellaceae bacterium]|nr:deoxyribodipyrimidine photo-lyase [Stellaceae bacterium]